VWEGRSHVKRRKDSRKSARKRSLQHRMIRCIKSVLRFKMKSLMLKDANVRKQS
jgi:hypothetical protein